MWVVKIYLLIINLQGLSGIFAIVSLTFTPKSCETALVSCETALVSCETALVSCETALVSL